MRIFRSLVSVALVSCLCIAGASAQVSTNITSLPLAGSPPTIDGVMSAGEWIGPPSASLRSTDYPIDTDVYFRNDAKYLYVLVDAIGDTTDDSGAAQCWQGDEALLVFGLPPNAMRAEIFAYDSIKTRPAYSVADQSDMGMSPPGPSSQHRTYEFRIPLATLGVSPGGSIAFYSPREIKGPCGPVSMPYDGKTGRDNVYPAGLLFNGEVTGYALLQLSTLPVAASLPVPALSDYGLLLLAGLMGLGGYLAMRRRAH
jgi:hypothetical protein